MDNEIKLKLKRLIEAKQYNSMKKQEDALMDEDDDEDGQCDEDEIEGGVLVMDESMECDLRAGDDASTFQDERPGSFIHEGFNRPMSKRERHRYAAAKYRRKEILTKEQLERNEKQLLAENAQLQAQIKDLESIRECCLEELNTVNKADLHRALNAHAALVPTHIHDQVLGIRQELYRKMASDLKLPMASKTTQQATIRIDPAATDQVVPIQSYKRKIDDVEDVCISSSSSSSYSTSSSSSSNLSRTDLKIGSPVNNANRSRTNPGQILTARPISIVRNKCVSPDSKMSSVGPVTVVDLCVSTNKKQHHPIDTKSSSEVADVGKCSIQTGIEMKQPTSILGQLIGNNAHVTPLSHGQPPSTAAKQTLLTGLGLFKSSPERNRKLQESKVDADTRSKLKVASTKPASELIQKVAKSISTRTSLESRFQFQGIAMPAANQFQSQNPPPVSSTQRPLGQGMPSTATMPPYQTFKLLLAADKLSKTPYPKISTSASPRLPFQSTSTLAPPTRISFNTTSTTVAEKLAANKTSPQVADIDRLDVDKTLISDRLPGNIPPTSSVHERLSLTIKPSTSSADDRLPMSLSKVSDVNRQPIKDTYVQVGDRLPLKKTHLPSAPIEQHPSYKKIPAESLPFNETRLPSAVAGQHSPAKKVTTDSLPFNKPHLPTAPVEQQSPAKRSAAECLPFTHLLSAAALHHGPAKTTVAQNLPFNKAHLLLTHAGQYSPVKKAVGESLPFSKTHLSSSVAEQNSPAKRNMSSAVEQHHPVKRAAIENLSFTHLLSTPADVHHSPAIRTTTESLPFNKTHLPPGVAQCTTAIRTYSSTQDLHPVGAKQASPIDLSKSVQGAEEASFNIAKHQTSPIDLSKPSSINKLPIDLSKSSTVEEMPIDLTRSSNIRNLPISPVQSSEGFMGLTHVSSEAENISDASGDSDSEMDEDGSSAASSIDSNPIVIWVKPIPNSDGSLPCVDVSKAHKMVEAGAELSQSALQQSYQSSKQSSEFQPVNQDQAFGGMQPRPQHPRPQLSTPHSKPSKLTPTSLYGSFVESDDITSIENTPGVITLTVDRRPYNNATKSGPHFRAAPTLSTSRRREAPLHHEQTQHSSTAVQLKHKSLVNREVDYMCRALLPGETRKDRQRYASAKNRRKNRLMKDALKFDEKQLTDANTELNEIIAELEQAKGSCLAMLITGNKSLTNKLLLSRSQIPEPLWDSVGVTISFLVPLPPDCLDVSNPGGAMNIIASVPCRMLNADASTWPEPSNPNILRRVQMNVKFKELEWNDTLLPAEHHQRKDALLPDAEHQQKDAARDEEKRMIGVESGKQ